MHYIFPYDDNGNLYPHPYYGTEQALSNPPHGWNLLPAIDATDTTAQAAYQACESLQPQQYIVSAGVLTPNPNWPAQQLAQAKTTQITLLRAGYMQTLAAGFQATITAGTYTFGWQTADESNLNALQTAVASSYLSYPVQYADVNGNPVSIASASDLTTIEQTAAKFMAAQHQQVLTLIGQVQAITTATPNYLSAVEALVWAPASY